MNKHLRIIIPGGNGQVGTVLSRHFHAQGHEVVVLARKVVPAPWRVVSWDGEHLGDWTSKLENSDVVINLAGRSVNCRYTAANRRAIMDSRTETTRLLGKTIGQLAHPPRLWMNASTATPKAGGAPLCLLFVNGKSRAQRLTYHIIKCRIWLRSDQQYTIQRVFGGLGKDERGRAANL